MLSEYLYQNTQMIIFNISDSNKYFNKLKKHISLFVIAFSSLLFFILNIFLKEKLSLIDYGTYSIFITYVSLLMSFGMLGFEQTLLRTTVIDNKLNIDKKIILPSIISFSCICFLGSYLMIANYDIRLDFFKILILSFCVILTKLTFNLLRLKSWFVMSQIVLNFWKLTIFLVFCYYLFFDIDFNIKYLVNYILLFFFISALTLIGVFKEINLIKNKNTYDLIKKSGLFFMTLFTVSLINFGDRFFIESRFGLEELGNYFFYINVFLFPFSLFQTYVGFKEIIVFKKEFNKEILFKKIKYLIKYSVFFSLVLFAFLYLIEYLNIYDLHIKSNLNIIIPLIFLGNIKVLYSLLSSAMGATCDDSMLKNINVKSVISLAFILPCIYYLSFNISITIIFVIALWIIRCLIWYNQLKKNEI